MAMGEHEFDSAQDSLEMVTIYHLPVKKMER